MTVGVYFIYYSMDEYTWFGTIQMFPFHEQWITPESYFYLLAVYMVRVLFFLTLAHLTDYIVKALNGGNRFNHFVNGFLVLCLFEIGATVNFICRFGESFWMKGFDTITIRAIAIFIVAATCITIEQLRKYAVR